MPDSPVETFNSERFSSHLRPGSLGEATPCGAESFRCPARWCGPRSEGFFRRTLEAPTEGWIAVGFTPSRIMKDANLNLGYVQHGEVSMRDDFGNWYTSQVSDVSQGGTNDVSVVEGGESGGSSHHFGDLSVLRHLHGRRYIRAVRHGRGYRSSAEAPMRALRLRGTLPPREGCTPVKALYENPTNSFRFSSHSFKRIQARLFQKVRGCFSCSAGTES